MAHYQNFNRNYSVNNKQKNQLLSPISSLHFMDVIYKVNVTKEKKKRILKHINLNLLTNEMYALMGSSGSGKTTLLDLIAQRKVVGTWSGNIFVNNNLNEVLMKHDIAYVLQDDIHIPVLTVEETLLYAAWTKLSEDITKQQRMQRVDEVLGIMNLDSVRNNIVGDILSKGISGGQMKRLSIAVEIIALQKVILLDEPTSGLDSSIALEIMTGIKKLLTKDRICLSTIHQPSKELFGLFDKVILLCMGRVIFCGNVNQVIEYFTQPKLGYEVVPQDRNPAEFIIDICCGKILPQGSYIPKQAEELEILFKTSSFCILSSELMLSPRKKNIEIPPEKFYYEYYLPSYLISDNYHVTSFCTQISMLFHRTWTAKLRNFNVIKVEILYRIAVAILFGIVFFGKGHVQEPLYNNGVLSSDARSYNSLLNLIVSLTLFVHMTAISAISKSFLVYKRELSSTTYSTTALFLSEVFALLPWHFFLHSIFMVILYLMTSMKSNSDYFFYLLFLSFVATYIAYSTALLLAFYFTEQVAFVVYQLNFMVLSAFAGFMIHVNDIPLALQWISSIVYSRWYFEGLMVNQWDFYDTDDIKDDYERNGSGNVLEEFGFDNFNKNNSFGILFLFLSIYLLLYYIVLNSRSSQLVKEEAQLDYFTVLPPSTYSELTSNSDNSSDKLNVTDTKNTTVTQNPILMLSNKSNSKTDNNTKQANTSNINNDKIKRSSNSVFELEIGLLDNAFFHTKNPSSRILQKESNDFEDMEVDALLVNEPLKDVSYFYTKSISVSVAKTTKSTFVFKDVCCAIDHPLGSKAITTSSTTTTTSNNIPQMVLLNNVSGYVQSGEMCGLMGTSGAGKSTLLDVLTRRKTSGRISGTIVLNGEPDIDGFNYVPQEDLHYAQLTVEESIYFSAELKLDSNLSTLEKKRRINDVMNMLAIDEIKDSIIGPSLNRNISGGQLRRVSIAVEIICLYQLFYLDEPTTGLDSSTALEVLSAIRNLTNINQMITICSIHQPSELAFALFDKLLLLGGGKVIYFGPISGLINYFTTQSSVINFQYKTNMNPADFVIAIANSLLPTVITEKYLTIEELSDHYLTTIQYQATIEAIKDFIVVTNDDDDISNMINHKSKQSSFANNIYNCVSQHYYMIKKKNNSNRMLTYRTNLFHQIKVLLHRRFFIMIRSQNVIIAQMIRNTVMAIFYGLLFFQMSTGSDSSCYDDRLSLMFFAVTNQLFVHVNTITEFYNERGLYYKEKSSKSYRILAYLFSLSIPQMLLQFPLVLVYCGILYTMSGLRSNSFGNFLLIVLLCNYAVMILGFCLSSFTNTLQASLDYLQFLSSINWLYCGFFVFLPDFPDWEGSWIPYLVYMRYAFQGIVLNEFQNNNDLPLSHTYIHDMGYDTISIEGCICILLFYILFLTLLFYTILCFFYDEKR